MSENLRIFLRIHLENEFGLADIPIEVDEIYRGIISISQIVRQCDLGRLFTLVVSISFFPHLSVRPARYPLGTMECLPLWSEFPGSVLSTMSEICGISEQKLPKVDKI
jgi:hypothetical protein